jgi:hypothetical protein
MSSSSGGSSSSADSPSTALVEVADRSVSNNYATDSIINGLVPVGLQWRHTSGVEITFQYVHALYGAKLVDFVSFWLQFKLQRLTFLYILSTFSAGTSLLPPTSPPSSS